MISFERGRSVCLEAGDGWDDHKAVMQAAQQVSWGGGVGGEGMVAVCFESGEGDIFSSGGEGGALCLCRGGGGLEKIQAVMKARQQVGRKG